MYDAVDSVFITYDDPQSIRLKASYVRKNKLGGMMFWQLSQDSKEYDLTWTMYEAIKY
ncbi:glycosyl hydrolase family 18 protein [Saccharicrinis sp. GN24d3]|uniref:glycosyl hydrolase family 18 protein n=1 Tax=Saccharicrinis sp. GN24d3 TaxID=3458416 RepID=UPI004036B806